MKSSSIRLPEELRAALKREAYERFSRGEPEPSFGDLLLEAWRSHKGENPPPSTTTAEVPGLLAGLTADDQFTIHSLAEILRANPQGSVFQILRNVLHFAHLEFMALSEASKGDTHPKRKYSL